VAAGTLEVPAVGRRGEAPLGDPHHPRQRMSSLTWRISAESPVLPG
jgi:hypothetical protein